MKYDVRFTEEAQACVRFIRDWLSQRSPEGALRWLDTLENACHQVAERAGTFPLAPKAAEFSEPLRQVLFKTRRGKTYRALFVIRGNVVSVVSLRGAGQAPLDPASILITPDDA